MYWRKYVQQVLFGFLQNKIERYNRVPDSALIYLLFRQIIHFNNKRDVISFFFLSVVYK